MAIDSKHPETLQRHAGWSADATEGYVRLSIGLEHTTFVQISSAA